MIQHIIFIIITLAAFGLLYHSLRNVFKIIKILRTPYPITQIGKRLLMFLKIAIGQNKIFRFPIAGFFHAMVFWGFIIITLGSLEMLLDGTMGNVFDMNLKNDRVLSLMGNFYNFIIAFGEIFSILIIISIVVFIIRRAYLRIRRFEGVEMHLAEQQDAIVALVFILLLMVTLIWSNTGYVALGLKTDIQIAGNYPISEYFAPTLLSWTPFQIHLFTLINWWAHILLIYMFMNYLPFSKHFHVFLSMPNVFVSRLTPLTQLPVVESVKKEVEIMLNPDSAPPAAENAPPPERFGIKDVEDGTWKNYLDSLTCTQCGRCTSVCPANLTGKLLSPRKLITDYRHRMTEKSIGLLKEGKTFDDEMSLLGDYISAEELWACTTCGACTNECPVNVDHQTLIADLRRFVFMEMAAAPSGLNSVSTNIENNGAPWQYSAADRLNWAEGLPFTVPTMADLAAENKTPDILFWVGSAGSFDDRAKKITRSFAKILNHCAINYAVLGTEETDSGDVARRAGNEFLFQLQAMQNITTLNSYNIKRIVTCCPHDFNTLKNEYPDLGGNYEVIHHSQFIQQLIENKKLNIDKNSFTGKRITYHDPCYLGRGNGIYNPVRSILNATNCELVEMHRNRSTSLCCGAGGGQLFKEAEKGTDEIYMLRTRDAYKVRPQIIATACPFCMTMLTDGVKMSEKPEKPIVSDIAELVVEAARIG